MVDLIERIDTYINESRSDAYMHLVTSYRDTNQLKKDLLAAYTKVKEDFINVYGHDPYTTDILFSFDKIFKLLEDIKRIKNYKSMTVELELFSVYSKDFRLSMTLDSNYECSTADILDTMKSSLEGDISKEQAIEAIIEETQETLYHVTDTRLKRKVTTTISANSSAKQKYSFLIEIDGLI